MAESQIAEAAVAIGALEKDKTNTHSNYKYISEAAVKAAVRAHVYSRGLAPQAVAVEIISDEWHPYGSQGNMANFVKVSCTITIVDGDDTRKVDGLGAGVDYADKALMKAQTAAVREAWKNMLGISDGNDPEASPAGDERRPPPQHAPQEKPRDVVIPFGKNKGVKLGDLPLRSLNWYAEKANEQWLRDACRAVIDMQTKEIDPTKEDPESEPNYLEPPREPGSDDEPGLF
jgi:hypothetical protein